MPGKWRWLAVVAAAFPQCAYATPGSHPVLHLHEGTTEVSITGGAANADSTGVKGEADLHLAVAGVTTTISGTAHTESRDAETHGSAGVHVDTEWQRGPARVQLKAGSSVHSAVQDGAVGSGALYAARTEQQNQTQSASATADFAPVSTVTLEAGIETRGTVTAQRQAIDGATPATSRVETRAEREYAKATWKALPGVTVEAQMATATTDMTMHGTVNGQTAYRAVEPSARIATKPWDGGTLSLGAARDVSPLNAANLAAYAAATGKPADATLQPDSAQRVTAKFSQTLGAVSLSAAYSNSELLSTTVLVAAASGQTPSSIAGGRRQTFSAAFRLSLAAIGLPRTTVSSKAIWRRSRIRDPLTGRARRVSGEIPHEAHFEIAQALPVQHLRFGIDGKLGTETRYYQASQETVVAEGSSLGAFVQYTPGPFSLRFKVDGLGGSTERRDAFYAGTRASGDIDHVLHGSISGPSVGLTLTKALDG